MSKTANDRQVGGKHYKRRYEHWDWVLDTKLGYLEGCATKYLSRWWLKGGITDIDKALHYLDKAIETARQMEQIRKTAIVQMVPYTDTIEAAWLRYTHTQTQQFAAAYELNVHEHVIMAVIASWISCSDLRTAYNLLTDYRALVLSMDGKRVGLQAAEGDEPARGELVSLMARRAAPPDPVPLEDSNKHADRVKD